MKNLQWWILVVFIVSVCMLPFAMLQNQSFDSSGSVAPDAKDTVMNKFQLLQQLQGEPGEEFGKAMKMSPDGTFLFVTAKNRTTGEGSVLIYRKQNGGGNEEWKLQSQLLPLEKLAVPSNATDTDSDTNTNTTTNSTSSSQTSVSLFGEKISFSKDGNFVLISQFGELSEVYLFERKSNDDWALLKRFSYPESDFYIRTGGFAVSNGAQYIFLPTLDLSSVTTDGNVMYSVHLLKRDDNAGSWSILDILSMPNASVLGDNFFAFEMETDATGETIFISNYNEGKGSLFIYNLTNDNFTHQYTFYPVHPDTMNYFGSSMAVSKDGNYLIVGSPAESEAIGLAYVYSKLDGEWKLTSRIVSPSPTENDMFGFAVSIGENATSIAVTSVGFTQNNMGMQGNVWIFEKIQDELDAWLPPTSLAQSLALNKNESADSTPVFQGVLGSPLSMSAGGDYVVAGLTLNTYTDSNEDNQNTRYGKIFIFNKKL